MENSTFSITITEDLSRLTKKAQYSTITSSEDIYS